jgi:EAL domain
MASCSRQPRHPFAAGSPIFRPSHTGASGSIPPGNVVALLNAFLATSNLSYTTAPNETSAVVLGVEIEGPDDGATIIAAIIAMAHSLGLSVVAEGVETELQRAYLQAQACDEFQGYLVSKPVPAEDFAAKFLAVNESTRASRAPAHRA